MNKKCELILKELENEGKLNVWWDFNFPEKEELKLRLKDMLEEEVDEKYYLKDKQVERIKTTTYNVGKTRIQEKNYCDTLCARDWKDPKCIQVAKLDIKGIDQMKRVYSDEGLSPSLTTCGGGNTEPKILEELPGAYGENVPIINSYKIRKLTPKEFWRLMGFTDEDFDKAQAVPTSNTQLYRQAGNSIVVNVLEKIFKNLFETIDNKT